ncbi:MAG: glycerophosphodiester phosphodiesterase [Alphaproteobacteria bacterium]
MAERRTDVPRIIGHRGAAAHAPENTLAGIRKAHELGCTWVEFDCMLTRDNAVILHHDDELDRTTSGNGLVADTSLQTIQGYDAGAWFSGDYAATRVPLFSEAVSVLHQLGMGANVEIKPTEGRERETGRIVAEETMRLWRADMPPPVMSSFSLDALEAAMEAAPELDRAILWWNIPEDWADHHERLDASAAHISIRKTEDAQAQAFADAGVPMRVYTVNEPAQAEKAFGWGAEAIFTDYPDRFI